ncbi:hypothetical protein [Pseudomonas sp.]|uniref:hypothetical protein n=1 Tax=Pseudomonas sp. TaxID=306 RepID=UPI0024891F73|nr:hypothetical protein [Pseudomonas sp.]MDI1333229.1 hypothetical protein [Pseudomonas sp.]
MTNKKDTNDFDFEDSNDFDFGDEVTAKKEPTPNVIKRQNTINEKEVERRAMAQAAVVKTNTVTELDIKSLDEEFEDFDFGNTLPKPTMIRKIDCTSLNEAEKHFVCLALTIRDQTKRKSLLNDQLIRVRFIKENFEGRMDFIADIIKGVVESNRLEANGKKYFFNALKKSMVSLLVELVEEEFKDLDQLINEEIEKNS